MRIIGAVYKLTKENKEPVILVTNDAAMRFNAFVSTKIQSQSRITGMRQLRQMSTIQARRNLLSARP